MSTEWKHTRAPWSYSWNEDDGFTIRLGGGNGVHQTIRYAEALYPEDGDGTQYAEAEANTRLMVTSPDMVETLYEIGQWFGDHDVLTEEELVLAHKIEWVIAKATGGRSDESS